MKFSTLVYGLAMLATSVLGTVVTGAPGGQKTRYEVRQLASQNSQQWTLFLLAMAKFQSQPQSSQLSYYQIAGIHGVPRQNWDGVGQCSSCSGADGYCTHSSILFLGWHRTYLALFEQQLVATAISIAKQYPTSTRSSYLAAASSLRLPYWDWAAIPPSGNVLPSVVTNPTVTVTGPKGSKTMTNPLYSYHFASEAGLVYTPFMSWPNTLRYPNSDAASATSNEQSDITAFNNIQPSLQDQVYQIYSTCNTFAEVGADAASQSSVQCSNSLEQIHNTVHTTSGGPGSSTVSGGHMTYLATAAFDPIFWLHHCNVDRLFAMWQAVYPTSYSGSQVAPAGTWTIAQGTTQNVNSPLTPFHKDTAGNFWTTVGVRSWWNFNYTYPEFADSDGSSSAIKQYINNLYGPNANATAGSSKRDISYQHEARDSTPLVANNGSLYQYVANIKTSRYALNGSYYIYLFNGNPATETPSQWLLDSNLIGPMGIFAQEGMTADIIASGSIPLTRTLSNVVSNGTLAGLSEALVVPYLINNLQWRIVGPDGSEVDPSSVPSFDVTVYASTATEPASDELPQWSAFIPLDDVTKGRNGTTNGTASASASIAKSTAKSTGSTVTTTGTSTETSGTTTSTTTGTTTNTTTATTVTTA